jgi:hypothetical protein
MAGRDISVTHEALGAVRVMRTCGMMGEVVGMAVSLCKKYNTTGRGVYKKYLKQLKTMMKGEDIAKWLKKAGRNLARDAKVEVSSNYDTIKYPRENINDGRYDIKDNEQRWLSSALEIPDYVTFCWDQPRMISSVRIISGWFNGKQSVDWISRFRLQRGQGSGWEDVKGFRILSKSRVESVWTFPEIRADRVRLVVTGTPGNICRIWEVEFYHRPTVSQ